MLVVFSGHSVSRLRDSPALWSSLARPLREPISSGRVASNQPRGGTLFLDEVGELSLTLQVKLLRFLQERQIERVGGRGQISVDTRVMAATNVDRKKAMGDGRLREDLYYRLGVVVISVPPLREREGDILLLAMALVQRCAAETRKKVSGFTRQALRALETYRWPGNVRQLENQIKRAVIMAEGSQITPADMEMAPPYGQCEGRGLREARQALEKDLIQRTLARHKGNVTQCATELGISRPTLYELLSKYDISR